MLQQGTENVHDIESKLHSLRKHSPLEKCLTKPEILNEFEFLSTNEC